MVEHVVLCGLSKEQQSEFPVGKILSFEKGKGRLNLKLDQLRNRMLDNEPARLTDFVEIASYVFAADRMTSRGPLTDPGFGAQWRRSFRLIVAVQELTFWQRVDVKAALIDALEFLSEDQWTFEFVENLHPVPLQDYLGLKPAEGISEGATSTLLFSGGLDSLAGAVHELRTTNRHVVLVSHRNLSTVGSRQRQLATKLSNDFPGRVTHVWVDSSLTDETAPVEETQRTRSFFFTAIGAVAAHIDPSDRIRFYENGIMSVNLPFATQLVGARASRSTHPRSLQLLKHLVGLVSMHPIEIENPFIWKTKVEVVRDLAATAQAKLITETNSCSRSQYAIRKFQSHCGTCVQCLQRRISTLGAGAAELDEPEGYETDLLEGMRKDGIDRVMAIETVTLAVDCAGMSDRDFAGRFAEPLASVLKVHPSGEKADIAKKVIDLYRRHGESVRSIFIDATGLYAASLLDGALPPSSLLALVLKDRLVEPIPGPSAAVIVDAPPKPEPAEQGLRSVEQTIVVAIDERKRAIRISDQPELSGATIFPLMKLLIEVSLAERAKAGRPQNYRCLRAKAIADQLGGSDEIAVRAAVRRARIGLEESSVGLGLPFDPNAIIERTRTGYRLNPKVIIVPLDEVGRQ